MHSRPIHNQIYSIWQKRFAGYWLDAQDEYLHFLAQNEFSTPSDNPDSFFEALLEKFKSFPVCVDIALLEVSFRRRVDSTPDLAAEFLESLRRWLEGHKQEKNYFLLHYQAGLNEVMNHSWWPALKFFVAAKQSLEKPQIECQTLTAQSKREFSSMAEFNISLCMENLGLDISQYIKKFSEKIITQELPVSLRRSMQASILRHAFLTGSCEFTGYDHPSLRESHDLDVLEYYRHYFSTLPNIDCLEFKSPDATASLEPTVGNFKALQKYQHDLRLRTLSSLWDNADFSAPADALVERLYLWTWKFLEKPDLQGAQKVKLVLRALAQKNEQPLSPAEYMMLSNSLGWIGLFDSEFHSLRSSSLERIFTGKNYQQPDSVLNFEKLLLDYLHAESSHDASLADTLKGQCLHSIETGKETYFLAKLTVLARKLLEKGYACKESFNLHDLCSNLENLTSEDHSSEPAWNESIRVVERNAEILFFHQKESENDLSNQSPLKIHSEILCLALKAFAATDVIGIETFLEIFFGIRRYNSDIHDSKIAHTLAKLNKAAQGIFSFHRRHTQIAIQKHTQSRIQFVIVKHRNFIKQANFLDLDVKQSKKITKIPSTQASQEGELNVINQSATKQPQTPVDNMEATQWYPRSEVETLFGWSRSTAGRNLDRWVKLKKIERRGTGKSTRYGFDRFFLERQQKKITGDYYV